MKDCGSCRHFIKLKGDRISGGLCSARDCRTGTGHGRKCVMWKGIKYSRRTP